MNAFPLQQLVRHLYGDGTYSYHYAPVKANKDDALVNSDDAVSTDHPADRFTYWPPQPMIGWLESPPEI